MLEINNLKFSYKDHQVLKGVNLQIPKGCIFGLLGKNGAGKTTLFESLYQNFKFSGEILWNNQNLERKNISYIETENYFYPYITGEEYLNYFSENQNITELTDRFSLPLKKFIQDYSSGMKKKIALLGMLLLNKPINILDEPFNGIDFEGVHVLYDIIKNLKSQNKTVIISSHIIETLFNTCDKIAVLQNGIISHIFDKENFDELKNFMF